MSASFNVHATAVVVAEAAVLLRGASGAGKSSLALQVIEAAQLRGLFARLVADDRVALRCLHGRVVASALPATQGLVEERGTGILRVPYEASAVVRAVVDLHPAIGPDEAPPRLPESAHQRCALGDITLPRLVLNQRVVGEDAARRVMTFLARITLDSESL